MVMVVVMVVVARAAGRPDATGGGRGRGRGRAAGAVTGGRRRGRGRAAATRSSFLLIMRSYSIALFARRRVDSRPPPRHRRDVWSMAWWRVDSAARALPELTLS